jgi:hypothetical protein
MGSIIVLSVSHRDLRRRFQYKVNLLEYIRVFGKCIVRRWTVLQAHVYYLYLTAMHIKLKLHDLCYTYTPLFWDMLHSITKNIRYFR